MGGEGGALRGRYIGVAGSLGMSLKDDGEGSKGDAVMIVGGGACTGSCGVSDRYCLQAPWGYLRVLRRPPK